MDIDQRSRGDVGGERPVGAAACEKAQRRVSRGRREDVLAPFAGCAPSTDEGELTGYSSPVATLEGLRAADRGDWVVYAEVGPRLVSPAERLLAAATVERASAALGIDPPELRWFDRETDAEETYARRYGWRDWTWWPGDPRLLGLYVRPFHEIWLRAGLEPTQVVATVAHEVHHAAQDDLAAAERRTQRETAAEEWALAYTSAATNSN
jgi:hypothetical protein